MHEETAAGDPDDTTTGDEPARRIDTGLPDEVYDLVLVLQQAAEDTIRYAAFAADARRAGDTEVAAWFEELAASDRDGVARAVELLSPRLSRPRSA